MGAQDRPQCHFDIEINREPGERGVLRAGRARAGGRTDERTPTASALQVPGSPASLVSCEVAVRGSWSQPVASRLTAFRVPLGVFALNSLTPTEVA